MVLAGSMSWQVIVLPPTCTWTVLGGWAGAVTVTVGGAAEGGVVVTDESPRIGPVSTAVLGGAGPIAMLP